MRSVLRERFTLTFMKLLTISELNISGENRLQLKSIELRMNNSMAQGYENEIACS